MLTPPSSSWRPGSRTWLSVLLLGFVLWVLISRAALIVEILAVVFAGYLLSLAISPLADFLERRGVPRGVAVLLFYAVSAALFFAALRLLVPVLRVEMNHVRRTLPEALDRALAALRNVPALGPLVPESSSALAQALGHQGTSLARPALTFALDIGGLGIDLIVALVLAYFFTTDREIGNHLFYHWIPERHRPRVRRVVGVLRYRLTRWFWAQVAVALYFAVAFSLILALLHVPFAFTIGLIGGLLELIPYFGGFVAFSLASLSALSVNPLLVLWILILYVIVTETEGHVLAPALYGKVTGLHPAAVLVALLIGAKAAHLVGVLFAVPSAVLAATLIAEAQGRLSPSPDAQLQPDGGSPGSDDEPDTVPAGSTGGRAPE